jgi:hypothetical protein
MDRARLTPLFAACLAAAGLAGCIAPPSSAQRLTDAAYEMNVAARFGRMDIAAEHVGVTVRDEFAKRHQAWGRAVRIVDVEFGGVSLTKEGAEVQVVVTWQRPEDPIIRVTNVTQRWTDVRGSWRLMSEDEKGDLGLFGAREKAKADSGAPKDAPEPVEAPKPPAPGTGRYQTRVIYGD